MRKISVTLAVTVLLAACANTTPNAAKAPSTGTEPALVSLSGFAQAPSHLLNGNTGNLITNNTSNVISNGGGSVVSNGGGNLTRAPYRLMATLWQPVPSATVTALNASGQPIAGVETAKTGEDGHFTLTHLPSGVVVTVQITAGSLTLTSLAKTDGAAVEVNPATTLATEHVRSVLQDNSKALDAIPLDDFRALTANVRTAWEQDDVKLPLTNRKDAQNAFAAIANSHPEVAKQETIVKQHAEENAKKQAEQAPGPQASRVPPSPQPSGTGDNQRPTAQGSHSPSESEPQRAQGGDSSEKNAASIAPSATQSSPGHSENEGSISSPTPSATTWASTKPEDSNSQGANTSSSSPKPTESPEKSVSSPTPTPMPTTSAKSSSDGNGNGNGENN